jgi:DNA-binding GntR family transcriptional regulator
VVHSRLNHELCDRIRELSGRQLAVELLEGLNGKLVGHGFQLVLRPGRARQSLSEHLAMIEEIRARDPQAAEAAVRTHLAGVIDALRR